MELPVCEPSPILYEDRSALGMDKPRGWMLVPVSWQSTTRNLQAAINSSIAARDFWARTRSLKFLRYVHRLDADTSGVRLFAKSLGAVEIYSKMFESRQMEKKYLAVASGRALDIEWTCQLKLAPDPGQVGRVKVDARQGKPAETRFRLLQSHEKFLLIEACPVTAAPIRFGCTSPRPGCRWWGMNFMGVRKAVYRLACAPFRCRISIRSLKCVEIRAPTESFLKAYGF